MVISKEIDSATQVQILDKTVAFHFSLMPLENAWIQLFSYPAMGKANEVL